MSASRKIAPIVSFLVASVAVTVLGISPGEAAKPKKGGFGCSVETLRSDFGKKCIDRNYSPSTRRPTRTWNVVCVLGEIKCCLVGSNGNIASSSCTEALSTAPPLDPKGDKNPRCEPGVACIPPVGGGTVNRP